MGFSGSSGGGAPVLPIAIPNGGQLASGNAGNNQIVASNTQSAVTLQGGNISLTASQLLGNGMTKIQMAGDINIDRVAAGIMQVDKLKSRAANEAAGATAGAGAAPPATVQGYVIIQDSGGVDRKVPYYAV